VEGALTPPDVCDTAVSLRIWRQRRRSQPITEALAYARCHGERGRDIVRVARLEPRRREHAFAVSGETLRQAFEAKLTQRTPT
jgi:hypothetical protein